MKQSLCRVPFGSSVSVLPPPCLVTLQVQGGDAPCKVGLFWQLRQGAQTSDKPRCEAREGQKHPFSFPRGLVLSVLRIRQHSLGHQLPAVTCVLAQYALFSKYAYLPP